jgi:hypothetical protein
LSSPVWGASSQVSALGVGLPSGAPFRCKHRIKHRKRGPGQRGPKFSGFGVGRGFATWGPFPVQAPDSAPETWTSLNKNLALHTALPVVDGWGGFAGFGGFVFTHGHFGFHKKHAAPVCMILVISWKLTREQEQSKPPKATDLMVFPAVSDHSRPLVRLAFICRPGWGSGQENWWFAPHGTYPGARAAWL